MNKKAYTAKDRIYNGTHGNVSIECAEFVASDLNSEDVVEIISLPVGTSLKELKIFNEDIGAGKKLQLFIQDKELNNLAVSQVVDVSSKAFTHVEGINHEIGDEGPCLLFAVLDPDPSHIKEYAKGLEHDTFTTKVAPPKLTSFAIVFVGNNFYTGQTRQMKVIDVKPPGASLKGIQWASDARSVVTIDEHGTMHLLDEGEVVIEAIVGNVRATAIVTVEQDPNAGG